MVLAVAWGAALAGWLALWMVPDKFESRAHIFIQTETILEPVFDGFTARPDYEQRVEVMRLQLLTRPNIEEVIYRAGLSNSIEGQNTVERRAKLEAMIGWLTEAIKIESPRDMYFVISFKHSDPEVAREVVDAVLNMLIEQDLGASLSENQAARRRLNLQIEEFEEKLSRSERRAAAFRRDNAVELASSQGARRRHEQKESDLGRIGDELAAARGRVLTLQNLLSATPATSSGDELDKLKVELADLRSKYKESHPDIRGVVARIKQLERGAGGALSSNPDYIRRESELRIAREEVVALEMREQRLRTELEALDLALGQAPEALAALQQIERQYETTKKTYEELLKRRDRLELTESLGPAGRGVEYQIFERPQRAITPAEPPRMLLIAGIFILAAGAGVGAGLLITALDKSYTQASELKEAFGLPVLGALSETTSAEMIELRRRDIKRMSGAFAVLMLVGACYSYLTVYRLPATAPDAGVPISVDLRTGALQ